MDAADASRVVHTDGNLTRWKNRVSNQHDAVLFNGNVVVLSDGMGGSLPAIDTTNGTLYVSDSNVSFDKWQKLTISMVYKWTGASSWNDAIWKGPGGNSPKAGYSMSKMNTGAGQGTGFWYGLSSSGDRLIGSSQTEAKYEPTLLTVVGDGSSGSVKLFANGFLVRSANNFPAKIVEAAQHDLKIGGAHLFSEILIYEDALDSMERESLESYLLGKWIPGYQGFSMDQNGTLRTSSIYDHESDDRNHTITVWATDQLGATFDKNFTIEITNVFEDMDGDGTEDFYDDDTDGDGLSNEQELANGSDPLDANSKNLAPSDINSSNLSIAENSAIGSIIGEFNATDTEGDSNLTFSIFPYPPRLWLDAEDNSSIVHTDGNVTRWKNKVSEQHDAVLASGNAKYLPNGLGDSSPAIDTTGVDLKILDSNNSFDEWGKLTIGMVYKWTSSNIWNDAIWKSSRSHLHNQRLFCSEIKHRCRSGNRILVQFVQY